MFKNKLKVIAGTLLAVVLISQLATPYSLTPAFAQAKDSILKPVNSPPTNNSNDKKPDKDKPTKDNSKDKSKAEATQAKPKAELPDKKLNSGNNLLKIKPLKELKSQDRSSSSEKKYKHVKMNGLPKEVDYNILEYCIYGYTTKFSGLKPNSAFVVKTNAYNDEHHEIADGNGVKVLYLQEPWRSNITFFEGDVIDNDTPKEEKIGYYNLSVLSGIGRNNNAGLSPMIAGVFIEACDESGKVIGSGVTNKDGECILSLKVPMKIQKIKIRQNKEKSPATVENFNIQYDTVEKEYNIFPRPIRTKLVDKQIAFYNKEKPEQKEYTITVQSVATKEGQPDRSLHNIPIEIYRNDGTLIASKSTNSEDSYGHYSTEEIKVKVFKGEKLKVKQIVDKAPSDLGVELDPNEKIITADDSLNKTVTFINKDLLELNDCCVKFNFQFPPNANVSFDACKFNFTYNVPDQLDANFIYISPHNFTVLLVNGNRTPIKRPQATNFAMVNTPKFPPGYYVESINGMSPDATFPNAPKEVTIKIGYKATGEFNYSARIEIPNEKYKGCFEAGLLDEKGHTVVSAVNDEKGNFNFEKIKYTEKDVGKHKYQTYIKPTEKGAKLKGALGGIKFYGVPNSSLYDEGFPFYITVKDNGNGTLTVSPDNTSSSYSTYLAPLLPVTGTIKTILAAGVLVLGTTTAIIIKRRKNTKNNHKNGN